MSLAIPQDLLQLAQSLYSRGLSDNEVSTQLKEKGTPENVLTEIIAHFKKIRLIKKRDRGFIWCGIGVTMLVAGCLLTFAFTGSREQMRIVMYGLTTIGACITFKGLIDVLGW